VVVRLDTVHEDGQQRVLREALLYPLDRYDVRDRLCHAEVLRSADQLGVADADLPCGDLGHLDPQSTVGAIAWLGVRR